MEEEKETLKGQGSGFREGQINRVGQSQPQSNEPDRNPQEKRLLQARSLIEEIVCEVEKPSGFFSFDAILARVLEALRPTETVSPSSFCTACLICHAISEYPAR